MTVTYAVGDSIAFSLDNLPASGIITHIISLDVIIVESRQGRHVLSAAELAGDQPTVFIKGRDDG